MKLSVTVILIFINLLFTPEIIAQKANKVKGTSGPVRQENNMTREQVNTKAEELAKVNAIQNAFGSYVEQDVNLRVENGKENFNIIAGTRVKGEWIRTEKLDFKEDIQELSSKNKTEKVLWITCSIEGEAREIHPKAKLDVFTLRCPNLDCQTEAYSDGQGFYLYFKSPVVGYLSVFIDEDGESVRRLFPYLNQGSESAVKIEGDKEYILFSKMIKPGTFNSVADEIELYTSRSIEYNNVYVIFSPLPYCKPILSDATLLSDGYILPRAISTVKFQEWLADCRAAMPDFQDKRIKISISNIR